MAVSWTTLSNAAVASGAAVTTSLMTALRDNPEGIAQRASGAPKIFGVPYDYQEFTSSGTWTKPSNAESGDVVLVQVVGAGGGGARNIVGGGGGGGGGAFQRFDDIDSLGATEAVVVGAGGAGATSTSSNGAAGGLSTFGTVNTFAYLRAIGGAGGTSAAGGAGGTVRRIVTNAGDPSGAFGQYGGSGGASSGDNGGSSITGGGGGGTSASPSAAGGPSMYAGGGGASNRSNAAERNGMFPGGGGGGGVNAGEVAGNGANGVVRVWCIKEA